MAASQDTQASFAGQIPLREVQKESLSRSKLRLPAARRQTLGKSKASRPLERERDR